jgi:hypothetical protein
VNATMTAAASHVEPGRPDTAPASPLFSGGSWLEANGRPCILRMELPIAADEMVAALYGEYQRLGLDDLASAEGVWAHIALVVVQEGLHEVEELAGKIREQAQAAALEAPEWLAYRRRRVAAVVGQVWQTKKHRCPCGYATDDMQLFDEHLIATENREPEHFEVLGGWSLEQVLTWRSFTTVHA